MIFFSQIMKIFLLINGLVYSFENKNIDNENDDLTEIFYFFKNIILKKLLKKLMETFH